MQQAQEHKLEQLQNMETVTQVQPQQQTYQPKKQHQMLQQ